MCSWNMWSYILKGELEHVYQEDNGVKIQRAPCKTDSLRAQVQDRQDENQFKTK